MNRFDDLKTRYTKFQAQREYLEKTLARKKDEKRHLSIMARKLDEAQAIVREVALRVQQELQYHISSVVSAALEAVFPDPYEFVVEFVERRGRTETDLYFVQRNGERVDPLTASGGGAVDVAAFALRAAIWRIQRPVPRPTIILDEPFRFLSQDLQPRAARMLREISRKLDLQIIMVTHNNDLLDAADQVFEFKKQRNKAKLQINDESNISENKK